MLLGFPLVVRSHELFCNRENLKRGIGHSMQPMFRGSSCFQSTFLAYRSCQLPSSRPHMQTLILIVHACSQFISWVSSLVLYLCKPPQSPSFLISKQHSC